MKADQELHPFLKTVRALLEDQTLNVTVVDGYENEASRELRARGEPINRRRAALGAYAATAAGLKAPDGAFPPAEVRRQLDTILLKMEQVLLRPEGLPRRPWYQHLIYAPGFYTGYGVKTLPGVREAIEERNWPEAAEQVDATARVLENYALEIDRARKLIAPPDATEP